MKLVAPFSDVMSADVLMGLTAAALRVFLSTVRSHTCAQVYFLLAFLGNLIMRCFSNLTELCLIDVFG